MAVTDAPAALDRDKLLQAFKELGDVGSVELKMSVPGEQRMLLRALGVDTLKGKIREVTFFDTPDLALFRAGLVVRGRRTQGKDDDTVVKLRPVQPADLPEEFRESPNIKIEMDVTRGAYVVSASMKGEQPPGRVQETLAGSRPLEKLYSKEQRRFFEQYAPQGVGWNDLVPLGPVFVVVVKFVPDGFSQRMVIEQWHYPGQVPLVELSTKAEPLDVMRVRAEAQEFLGGIGLSVSGDQEPKTRKALQFFAKGLQPGND